MIAYGIMSKVSNIDPDKVYDYHKPFEIYRTQVKFNVDINANNTSILNIALNRNLNSSAATVGMVKELIPFTVNHVYSRFFEQIYDFTDANNYELKRGASGIVISGLNHLHSLNGITIPDKDISNINKEGLNINNYTITLNPSDNFRNYTVCMVFYYWKNRNFALVKKIPQSSNYLLSLTYTKAAGYLTLITASKRQFFRLPNILNGKKIVLWLTHSVDSIVTKANLSNYSSTLTIDSANYQPNQIFDFTTDDGIMNKIMFSPNFYDFDSEAFKRIMIQEKINGSYIL